MLCEHRMGRLLGITKTLLCLLIFWLAHSSVTGAMRDVGLLRQWPQGGPRLAWSTDLLEEGSSVPAVLDGVVYVTGGHDEGSLFAFNMDGWLLWRHAYGRELVSGSIAGPRCSPIVERDVIILTSSIGEVQALRTDSRARLWSFNVFARYGGKLPAGGYNATPVRYGDLVILACGGAGERTPAVVAVDRMTGDTIWTAASLPDDSGVGDGGPSLVRHTGGELLIAPFCRGVLAIDPASGRRAWAWSTAGGGTSARPVCGDGLVYLPNVGARLGGTLDPARRNENRGVMLRVTEGGGYLELWNGAAATPGQVAVLDGRLFTGDECRDAVTGRVLGRLPELGGLITVAGGFLFYLQNGPTVSMVDPGMGTMRLVGRFRPDAIGERDLRVPPVIGEGRLFVRDRNRMSVYDLRQEPESSGSRVTGSGRYPGARPPISWSKSQNLLWRRQLPMTGLSSPVVHRGKVLMTGEQGSVVCCNAETGALEWMRDLNPKAGRAQRPTMVTGIEPVAAGERVWARFSDGTVLCLGLDGTAVWSSTVGPSSNMVFSAVLSDGMLILGGSDIVGLDATTGVERWRLRSQGQDLAVTGKAWVHDKGVVLSSEGHLVRSCDGTVIARDLPTAKGGCVAVDGTTVYAAVGDGVGYTLGAYQLPQRAERGMPLRSLWKITGHGSPPACLTAGEGRILLTTEDGDLHVHDIVNGVQLRLNRLTGDRTSSHNGRQLWAVGDRVYAGAPGCVGTVEVCRADSGEVVWSFATAQPLVGMTFADGRQFVRTGSVLYCIGGATPSRPPGPALVDSVPDSWLRSRGRRPISRVVTGEMPRLWLCGGPFAWNRGTDPLQTLGGVAACRPSPGDDAADGRKARRFAMLQEGKGRVSVGNSGGIRVIDFAGAADGAALPCAYYLFTTIENMSQRWFVYTASVVDGKQSNNGALRVRSWLGGSEVRSGDYVHVAAGRTALMVEVVVQSGLAERETLFVAPGFLEVEKEVVGQAQELDVAWRECEAESSRTFVLP